MRKKLSVLFLSVFILTLLPAVSVSTEEPLRGTMDLQFNLGWPGPQLDVPDWVGTITFEGDPNVYGMAFFAFGSGKPFGDKVTGSAFFFEEIWVIYDTLDFEFDENGFLIEFEPGSILLSGYDRGLTNMKNSKYHMIGYVEEANTPFSMWAGRNVHMSGDIIWYPNGAPYQAPGTFRIN